MLISVYFVHMVELSPLVNRVKDHRPYLQFYLACYHQKGNSISYYPINISFYVHSDDFAPIITLVPNKRILSLWCDFLLHVEYIVNRNATVYKVEDDNSVHFDFWKNSDNGMDTDISVIEYMMD